ncbi:membrane-associated protein, putative [Bodo saltans]|uniref:Membrane-associated protein, putative n=1 Tax=Bodo saltans TaxID=75058 RepID=A0A0S4JGV0_BODSA|nr:membrane-associated protein, putative [Bodo saltans]|eukprot:CUG89254.1 membrane-associated protein, putative [Bodo saltans]
MNSSTTLSVLLMILCLVCHQIDARGGATRTPSPTKTLTDDVSGSKTLSSSPSFTSEYTKSTTATVSFGTRSFTKDRSLTPSRSTEGSASGKTGSSSAASSSSRSSSSSASNSASSSRGSVTPSETATKYTPTSNASNTITPSLLPPTVSTSSMLSASSTVSISVEETATLSATRSRMTRSPPSASATYTATVSVSRTQSVNILAGWMPSYSASNPTPTDSNMGSSTKSPSRTSSSTPSLSMQGRSASSSRTPSGTTSLSADDTPSIHTPSRSSSGSSSSTVSTSPSGRTASGWPTASETPSHSNEWTPSLKSTSLSSTITGAISMSVSTMLTLTRPLPPSKTPTPSQQTSLSASDSGSNAPSVTRSPSVSRTPTLATRSLMFSFSASSSSSSAPSGTRTISADSDTASSSFELTPSRSASPSTLRSSSRSLSVEVGSVSHTQSASSSDEVTFTARSSSSTQTFSLTLSSEATVGTHSSSLTAPLSSSRTAMTSARRGGSMSPTAATHTPDASVSNSPSATSSLSPTTTHSNTRGTASLTPSFSLSPTTSRSSTETNTDAFTTSVTHSGRTLSPTYTRHRVSPTKLRTKSKASLTTTMSMSSLASQTLTVLGASPTNNNKSFSKTRSDVTATQWVTVTNTKRRTLTLTQTLVLDIHVANALGSYLLSAFDFSATSTNGPCSASASLVSLILIAFCVVGIATVVYLRLVQRKRPDIVASGEASPLRIVLRENAYTGVFFPCHYHCWWIHSLTCLVHVNLIFLVTACVLYAFEKQTGGGGGLLSGTSAIGVVAGIIGAALPHILRPVIDAGFYFVTYFQSDKRKCQNEDGMSWETWHRLAEERRAQHEQERLALLRRMEEDRKSGLHMLRTALTTDVDAAGGWGDSISPDDIDVGVPSNPIGDVAAQRAVTHEVDLCIDDDALVEWEPQVHDEAASMRARHKRLEAKWGTPLSQSWWGPVETHHLLVGVVMVLCVVAMLIGFQNIIHKFSSSACQDRTSPLAVALLICFFFDLFLFEPLHQCFRLVWRYALEKKNVGVVMVLCVLAMLIGFQNIIHKFSSSACQDRTSPLAVALLICFFFDLFLFEPLHQCFRLVWRYALEHEGNVDYTTTFLRRVTKLITLDSVPHPYFGAMLLWPEDALAEGTTYTLRGEDETGTDVLTSSVVDVENEEQEEERGDQLSLRSGRGGDDDAPANATTHDHHDHENEIEGMPYTGNALPVE